MKTLKHFVGWQIVGLLLISTLALGLRLYKIANPIADWHSFRQADTAAVTRNFVKGGVDLLHPKYDDLSNIQSGVDNPQGWRMVEFPVFNLVHWGVYQLSVIGCQLSILGCFSLETAGRLTSTISSLFALLFLYGIVKRLSGTKTALTTAFVFSILPFSVYYSRVILPDMMAVMWALGAIFWLGDSRYRLTHIFLSAAFAALALLTKPTAGFLLAPVIMLFFKMPPPGLSFKDREISLLSNKFINSLFWFGFYIAILLLPFYLWRNWIQQFPEGIPAWRWLLWEEIRPFQPAWWRWLFFERIGNLILGGWGLVFLIPGIIHQRNNGVFYLIWLASMLFYLTVFASGNVRHDYYQIILIPVICVFMAKGIIYFWSKKNFNRFISIPTSIFLILASVSFSLYQIKGYYQINDPAILDAGQVADKLLPENALVIAPYFGDTSFLYQINRKGWPLVTHYPIEEMLKRGATHYVSVTYDGFTRELMERFQILIQNEKFIILNLKKI
jgi:hypothetical protein